MRYFPHVKNFEYKHFIKPMESSFPQSTGEHHHHKDGIPFVEHGTSNSTLTVAAIIATADIMRVNKEQN